MVLIRKFKIIFLILLVSLVSFKAYANDIPMEAKVDSDRVSVGQNIRLDLIFNGIKTISAPDIRSIEGFEVQYIGPSSRVLSINGRTSISITHMYNLHAVKAGSYTLGPFSLSYGSDNYVSNKVSVEVISGSSSQAPSSQPAKSPVIYDDSGRLSDKVFLVMMPEKATAYVNEIVPIHIRLYVNRVSIRDIQYPEFSQKDFSVTGFNTKPTQRRELLNDVAYEVVDFTTYVYANRAGNFILEPAKARCNIMVQKKNRISFKGFRGLLDDDDFAGFFGGYDIYPLEVESEKVPISILPLPAAGKPASFNGSVGNFDFEVSASPTKVNIGDPITVSMKITGEGNFDTVMPPDIDVKDKFKVYEPELFKKENFRGFDEIIIPLEKSIAEVPPIEFSFFDPAANKYKTITSKVIPITVMEAKGGIAPFVAGVGQGAVRPFRDETFGRDIIYIKNSPGHLGKKEASLLDNRFFLFLNAIGGILFIGLIINFRKKERLEKDVKYARRLLAPKMAKKNLKEAGSLLKKGNTEAFYEAVFKILQSYLGDKFHLPTHGITITIVDDVLKTKGAKEEILEKLKNVFNECDLARYASSEFNKESMSKTFKSVSEILDYFERTHL